MKRGTGIHHTLNTITETAKRDLYGHGKFVSSGLLAE